jgi:apolipoprotein N-acyltransferase
MRTSGEAFSSYLLPLVSGIALIAAFPPFSVPLLPFVGLVPLLLFLNRPLSGRAVILGGAAFSVPYFVGSIYWLFNLARFTPAGAGGALITLFLHWATFLIFLAGLNIVQHTIRVPLPLSAPVLWTVSEHARTYGDLFFPWVTLGYSLSDWPALVQHADLIGVYGMSWWLVFINSLLVLVIDRDSRPQLRALACGVVILIIGVPIAYGAVRWRQVEQSLDGAPTLRVAVIQPNIPQRLKWTRQAWDENLALLSRLVSEAEDTGAELVVAPEASVPIILPSGAKNLPPQIVSGQRPLLLGVVHGIGVPGGSGDQAGQYRWHHNAAMLVAPNRSILAEHDKQYLVPITEQIPYQRVGRFRPGDELHLLELEDHVRPVRFGAMICYESLFPTLAQRMSRLGAQFFVNITNDAWFGRSSMPYQHLGFSVLRAIETRRSVVRSANTGVSAVVDPLGRVRARSKIFEEAILSADVPLADGETVFIQWGSVVLYPCYIATVILLGIAWRVHRRQRQIPPPSTREDGAARKKRPTGERAARSRYVAL